MAAAARAGTAAAILGYPLDGPFDAEPGRVGQTQTVSTENAYGVGHVQRSITALRGRVRPGNSGGPMVDAHGRVLATVFAALIGTSRPGGFAVPNALVRAELARVRGPAVGTGRCGS
jgi:S1-C subfamily serine protease